jgi:hypothetical protein
MWKIQNDFSSCTSKRDPSSKVKVKFRGKEYEGSVTVAKKGRKTPAYRLWYSDKLSYKLKNAFLMSFVRDIENRLRKATKRRQEKNIEDEIPFWEFLDIEYSRDDRIFLFKAYYIQKPQFSELFKHLIKSTILHKIDDELKDKPPFKIYKTEWTPRDELEFELGAQNVLYTLIDTKKKLMYIGEASKLVARLTQDHPSIPKWDYFRYNVLPNEIAPNRKILERMIIRDFASILENKGNKSCIKISDYKLTNDKID